MKCREGNVFIDVKIGKGYIVDCLELQRGQEILRNRKIKRY